MKRLNPSCCALSICAAAILLPGCGGSQSAAQEVPLASSAAHPAGSGQTSSKQLRRASVTEKVLYSFGSQQPDGTFPYSGLTYVNGTMYGVTSQGVPNVKRSVLFSITPMGTYTVLHRFRYDQGIEPLSELTAVGRNRVGLFGTALYGGTYRDGTVFESTSSGRTTVLHSFQGSPGDGIEPDSRLLNVNGTFYGTTFYGGSSGAGTVFSITPSGSEKVIYNFAGGNDGENPESDGLVEVNGTFYGTTWFGGAHGRGTVFSITPGGKESVLHSFLGGINDGANPFGQLVNVNGTLYGTTFDGGSGCQSTSGGACGTVFRVTPSGKERILYKFGGSPNDGAQPNGGLLYINGKLYGTTYYGGRTTTAGCTDIDGCGTVFSITPSGTETVLYRFAGRPDGANPAAGVIDVNGTLYGTTEEGGGIGDGTIYSITL